MNQTVPIYLLAEECERGGVARHIVEIANGLHALGREVHLFAPSGPMREELDKGITVIDIPAIPLMPLWKASWAIALQRTIVRTLRGRRAILHSHKRFTDGVARMSARLTKAVHISTCHNWFTDQRSLSVFGDWTACVSECVSRHVVSHYRKDAKRVRTIYNGVRHRDSVTTRSGGEERKRWGIDAKAPLLVSVGHFTAAKDRLLLLRAVQACRKELQERGAKIMLVGEGPSKSDAEAFAQGHELNSVIQFVPGDVQIDALWAIADLGVLSSRQEGLPYVILDAALHGVPHVATDVGGVSDFVKNGETGTLVRHGDEIALSKAILRMLDDNALRHKCGDGARSLVGQQHDYDIFMKNICTLYDEASHA